MTEISNGGRVVSPGLQVRSTVCTARGAFTFLQTRFADLALSPTYIGRRPAASLATGSHQLEQATFCHRAFHA